MTCVPAGRQLKLDPSPDLDEQFDAVMSRRYPYAGGWLEHRTHQALEYNDAAPLQPPERDVSSYLRVGVPGVGVLWIDSWDTQPLDVADKATAASFADTLSLIRPLEPPPRDYPG